jgi:Uma2 family endonuclease
MATATLPPPKSSSTTPAPAQFSTPRPVKWTCEEFYASVGLVFHDRKVILIDGEILEMAAPSPRSSLAQTKAEDWCRSVFPKDRYWVRGQMGMYFGINTDPVPDIAIVAGAPQLNTQHPKMAELVIEVSDTTLAYDLGDKASLYAAAGIKDYWVIDVENRQLYAFRDPQPDATKKYGHWYANVSVLNPTNTIAPLAAPNSPVSVGELLP